MWFRLRMVCSEIVHKVNRDEFSMYWGVFQNDIELVVNYIKFLLFNL